MKRLALCISIPTMLVACEYNTDKILAASELNNLRTVAETFAAAHELPVFGCTPVGTTLAGCKGVTKTGLPVEFSCTFDGCK